MRIGFRFLMCLIAPLTACSSDPLEPDARRSLGKLASSDAIFRDLVKSTNPNTGEVIVCGKIKDTTDVDFVRFIGHLPPAMPIFFERGGTQSYLLNLSWGACEGKWNDPIF